MIYATVNYRIIPYLNALCHSLASYGASTFLVRRLSTRNQSKSDSFLSLLSVTPVNCFPTILDSNDACPVASHYRPSRNFPSPFSPFSTVSKSNRILERSAILSEWKLDATPTFSGDGATTRSERNGREFGVEASLHFYETPPLPHSGVYNGGGAFHAACSCSRFVHRVSFVHPCNSCNDNLYEKCFPPFPRHRRCFPPLRARIVPHARNVGHLTIGQETWRVLPGWAKIPSMRLKAATKWGKEFPRK